MEERQVPLTKDTIIFIEARDPIDKERIQKNTDAITEQIKKIGENCLKGTGKELVMINNSEWYRGVNYSLFTCSISFSVTKKHIWIFLKVTM